MWAFTCPRCGTTIYKLLKEETFFCAACGWRQA